MSDTEKSKYEFFPDEISEMYSEQEIWISDEMKEELMVCANKQIHFDANVGFRMDRINHNDREMSFHKNWLEENKPFSAINYGQGVLQDILTKNDSKSFDIRGGKRMHDVTIIERRIVATVIQWLGSNIGFSFLERCLKDCGYEIKKIKS